ncbi:MAG: NAD(P)-binding protein [Streptosporangiales bacterium]|nr:NAD(P)-binding protein [Streptosporangiales bacterium]
MNTSPSPLKILIAGGGIGGLALAHGLRRAGIDVTVFERTVARTDWVQGYRIHINPDGGRALRACLPEANWRRFVATVSGAGDGFGFLSPRLTSLLDLRGDLLDHGADDPAERHHGVSRINLREVLLDGLGDVVEHGRAFERYSITQDGRVTAHLADGGAVTGDLLIGADGANSRVRDQFLPHAGRIDTGVVAVAGKYRLTAESRARLPRVLTTRANSVVPAGPGFLFTAVWEPDASAGSHGDGAAYTFWAYADAAGRLPAEGLGGEALIRLVGERIQGWSPRLRELVAESDPETVNAIRVRSAPPRVDPWETGPVTLLGDAIHSMTPMAGIGANTALRDADLLRRVLIEVAEGRRGLRDAVGEYERRMREYGFAAVRLSLRNARQVASGNPFARHGFRAFLRTANALPAMKRRMFADQGRAPDTAAR